MNPDKPFRGIICPPLTPFDSQGRVDIQTLQTLVDFLMRHGVDGLLPGGTTGEGMLLSQEERKLVAETVVREAAGRVPVIVHTGCVTTADTLDLTLHAQAIGATGASIITPYFFSYDDESLFQHYLAVARAVPHFPLALYSFPGNAKNKISVGLLKRLRQASDNILALKVSEPDLILFQEYVQAGGPGFCTLCGVDALALPALSVGAVGQVSGNSNVFPEVFRSLYDAFALGDLAEAGRQQVQINRIRSVLKDSVAYFKAAMPFRGIPVGDTRPPMRKPSGPELAELEAGLRSLGIP